MDETSRSGMNKYFEINDILDNNGIAIQYSSLGVGNL